MRVNGRKIEGPNVEIIAIPRGNGPAIIFQAKAVLDYSDFDKLCPMPQPPVMVKKGGIRTFNVADPVYKDELARHAEMKMAWLVLSSLSATEGLDWETVNLSDCSTWLNYKKELKESGFTPNEIDRIIGGVFEANGLDDAKIDEARASFLASREAANQVSLSQATEQPTT